MKKIYHYIAFLLIGFSLATFTSCDLDTEPTDKTTKDQIFTSVKGAYIALDGIYRLTYKTGWGTSRTDDAFGILSTGIFGDAMGEDFVIAEKGSGWFSDDYQYLEKDNYTKGTYRAYTTWNFYYKLISEANYILANVTDATAGDKADIDNVLGQAYAIRAYSYFYLIQFYQKTYIGNQNAPGVPIYTEPTTAETKGKPRGTVQDVYNLIDEDLIKALDYLKNAKKQIDKSHIDYYVANVIKAKVALVKNEWSTAESAAKEALNKPGLSLASASDITKGFNNADMAGVMWAAKIIEDQTTTWASFASHMDASIAYYAKRSRKCIGNWLYDQIPENDARKKWWKGKLNSDASTGPERSYNQLKFFVADKKSTRSDYIYMRAEEAILILAEAQCRQQKYAEARNTLQKLGDVRNPNYAAKLAILTDSDVQSFASTGTVTTLLDEILLQRRIELWGEAGRYFDIVRLKKGFSRTWAGNNHVFDLAAKNTTDPNWNGFVMSIPQAELIANEALDVTNDQNPF